jgi:hypothetical protein
MLTSFLNHGLILTSSSAGSISDALALRYLVGVLELPAFWRESGAIHITVFTKILDRVTCLLTDLGLDSGKDESEVRNGIILDNEGIDSMANVILVGVLDWHTTDPEPQYWYRSLTGIVRLLRLHVFTFRLLNSWFTFFPGPGPNVFCLRRRRLLLVPMLEILFQTLYLIDWIF